MRELKLSINCYFKYLRMIEFHEFPKTSFSEWTQNCFAKAKCTTFEFCEATYSCNYFIKNLD